MESSILKDMGAYKSNLITAFQNSEEICELLFDKRPYTQDDVQNLPYSQIFPYLHVDDALTDVTSYICVDVDMPKIPTNAIKDMKVCIWAYCHKQHMQYAKDGYVGTRADILADMIERRLRESDRFGIGKPQLTSVEHFFPNDKCYGKLLTYTIPAFKISKGSRS